MYDLRWIRDNPDAFDAGLAARGVAAEGLYTPRPRGLSKRPFHAPGLYSAACVPFHHP